MGDDTTADGARAKARDHLWLHFTNHAPLLAGAEVPVVTRAEGAYFWDDKGRRYLDALSGLFAVNAGHGRPELAEAAARQIRELDYFPIWNAIHPRAAELAEALAERAPGGMSVSGQIWLSRAAPDRVERVTGQYVGTFNASVALGSLAGGTVLAAAGTTTLLWSAAALVALALLVIPWSPNPPSAPPRGTSRD